MANLRIIPRNFHDEATLTASTEATGYPASNTQNCIRGRTWRSEDTASATISGSMEDSYTANFLGIFRHNGYGGTVTLQLYSDAAWTTEVYNSTALDLLINLSGMGSYEWGTPGVTNDPFQRDAPYWLYFPEMAFLSYRLTFASFDLFGQAYMEVCRLYLGKYHEFANNPNYGATLGRSDLTDSNRSRGGSLRTNVGASFATAAMDLGFMSESDTAFCLDLTRYCGTGKDIVASLYPEEVSRRERDNLINGKFVSLDAIGRQVSYLTKRFQIQEV